MKKSSKLAEYRRKRDFTRTAEPAGGTRAAGRPGLGLRDPEARGEPPAFDLRLELDGVMKSWAVPKGPSLDPAVKRLAMQVEDHPIEYNTFEGTIPKGEYGGGTVMLWDRGTYTYGGADDGDPVEALRRGYEKGDFKVVLHGKRLQGLVGAGADSPRRPEARASGCSSSIATMPRSRVGRGGGVPDVGGDRAHDGRDRGRPEAAGQSEARA